MSEYWTLEHIGPERAKEYLAKMPENRNVRRSRVAGIARAMKGGRFRLTHQGIAFNCDGSLKDGQHRLMAIVESGATVPLWVYRGLQNDAMLFIDTHSPRNDSDGLKLTGVEVDRIDVAVLKRFMGGIGQTPMAVRTGMDRDMLRRAWILYGESIRFARDLLAGNKRGWSHGSVVAIVARAWYTADRERLVHFAEVLKTGMSVKPDEDGAAIRLRDILITSSLRLGGDSSRAALSRKVESALGAFLAYRSLAKIYEAAEELFPVPELLDDDDIEATGGMHSASGGASAG